MSFVGADRARRLPQPSASGSLPFVSDERVDTLRDLIDAGLSGRMRQKWVPAP